MEQHRKFIQAGKGQEVDETPESTMSGIQTISSTSTVNINPATGVSVIVDGAQNPDLQVLRSTEATELDARREERRRRQAELGTDDEADETMIKEKKRKIIKKAVDEDTQEQDKKVILPAKKHEKRTSEVPKIDEPKPKPSPETMEMPPKAPAPQEPPQPVAPTHTPHHALPQPAASHQDKKDPLRASQPLTLSKLSQKSPIQKRTLKMKDKPVVGEHRPDGGEDEHDRDGRQDENGGKEADGVLGGPEVVHLTAGGSGGGRLGGSGLLQGGIGVGTAGGEGESGTMSPSKPRKAENLLIQPQVKFGQGGFGTKKPSDALPAVNLVIRKPLGLPQPSDNIPKGLALKKPGLSTEQKPSPDAWNDDFILGGSSASKSNGRLAMQQHENEDWDV